MEKVWTEVRVSSSSSVSSLAGCIVSMIEEKKDVELRAMGAGSVNQAIKACAKASGILASKNLILYFRPGFSVNNEGQKNERTLICLKIFVQ